MKDIGRNVDLLMLSDTKTDASFPKVQRLLKGSGDPFSLDRNVNGGWNKKLGKIFRQSFCLLNFYQEKVFLLQLIYGKKWLVSCSYKPHKENISNHLQMISKSLDLHLSQYDNIIIVENFNTEIGQNSMNGFCDRYTLQRN